MSDEDDRKLTLRFHGRVIEHLGIQMYQSPVNAIAEMIANSWDADATRVEVGLPATTTEDTVFTVTDNGLGMTFEECQNLYLEVGRNRRGDDPRERTPTLDRPVLGRKGIGKFAGFGIARTMTVETISSKNGERTVFRMDLDELMGDDYVSREGKEIDVLDYDEPDEDRAETSGTKVVLADLTIRRAPNADRFRESMARRFLLHQEQADFEVSVEEERLPDSYDAAGFEYVFPGDYPEERQEDIEILEGGWGREEVAGHEIKWRFLFNEETLDEDELKGIAIFTKGKLAQRPFFFNITRGLTGQHGTEYLAGQVVADYIDSLPTDLIATERQRINWEHAETEPLLEWGQRRLRESLRVWSELRAEEKTRQLQEKLTGFEERLSNLKTHEQKTVRRALKSLARISTLSDSQFEELGRSMLTAWEQGRLEDLIAVIAESEDLAEADLLEILLEARVLTALQTVEVVRTNLETIAGLRRRIEERELENAVRDFIADNPWLISPEWETFTRERGLETVLKEAAETADLTAEVYRGRVDLTMTSGNHLLVLEFVRPGQKVDWDHLSRFRRYVLTIRSRIRPETAGTFSRVTGILVADELTSEPEFREDLESMEQNDMYAMTWRELLRQAEVKWRDFMNILRERGGEDFRMEEHFAAATRQLEANGEGDEGEAAAAG